MIFKLEAALSVAKSQKKKPLQSLSQIKASMRNKIGEMRRERDGR